MKRIAAAAIASLLLSTSFAMAESKEDKALRVFELAITPEIIGDMGARTGRIFTDQVDAALAQRGKALSTDQRNEMIVRFGVMFNEMMVDLTPDVSRIYAEEMTERELDMMIEIYDDPEMAALMAKMPIVMERMTPLIQSEVPKRAQELIKGMVADGVLSDL